MKEDKENNTDPYKPLLYMNKHLHTIVLVKNPLYRFCEEEDETPLHCLSDCAGLTACRQSHFGEPKLELEILINTSIEDILDFFPGTALPL